MGRKHFIPCSARYVVSVLLSDHSNKDNHWDLRQHILSTARFDTASTSSVRRLGVVESVEYLVFAGTTGHGQDASGNRTGERYETCNNTNVLGKACGSRRIPDNLKNQDITLNY